MASISWTLGVNGNWTTAADWTPGTVPTAADDVTIDALAPAGGSYVVTIAAGDSVSVHSLTMNAAANLAGSNTNPYNAAELDIDGTLIFAPGSAGLLGGSLQNKIVLDGGTIVNGGTLNGFIQAAGDALMTGTNTLVIANYLQAIGGAVTIDTQAIGNITGNTLSSGVFEAKNAGGVINLGGALQHLIVNIATIAGSALNPAGSTELSFNDVGAEINEWTGTAYAGVETTLTEIAGGGVVNVLAGRGYTTAQTLTVDAGAGGTAGGIFNLHAGTVTTAGLNINGGVVQGSATIAGGVINNGILMALGGTMHLTGGLTGTGTVAFDLDTETGILNTAGATLEVNGVSAGQTIVMNGNDTLRIDAPAAFAGTIEATAGDTIVLTGLTVTSAIANNGTLTVFNGNQTVASLALAGNYTGEHFTASGSTLVLATGAPNLTISGAVAGQTTTDQATIAPFSHIVIADPNAGQTETLTVTVSAPANGVLTNLGGGTYNATTGVYTDTGSAGAVTADLEGLVFAPTPHQVAPGQIVTTGFAIAVTDTAQVSATDNATSVITLAAVAGPAILGARAGQAVTDQATIAPFANVVITDSNPGQNESVTVTLSAAGDGRLSNLGGGSYDAATGVYKDAGSAAAVTADLNGLVFTPTAGLVPAGQTRTTGFTISDTDTASVSATNSTTSVIVSGAQTQFATFDTTTGVASVSAGTPYSGPVAGLQWQFITTTSDSLNITATAPNTFIHTGSGSDAIDVSRVNGNNVLDGGTGSNFMVGGSGNDTFFVDDRGPKSDIWSTVVNFHSGDAATIFGVTPNDFTLAWANGQGAAGYTGLTLHATAPGLPIASLTLAGLTTADLTNGKLSVSFGTTAAAGGVAGSTYMYIHGN